ncbi:XylR family transcriptional regulator [Pelagicoccus sp. SDUM812005]|uniref:DNA-binding transcriptional regulator n=1 Tax=Pelagicoccus sp. SDUM812005 TaxID=3041257 RepID=UPI00280DE779|nr:XylR family transcriptional regulator [Pelagicoccus sp. SDUM812005]MDQ8183177.1 XylR family transcriptional regulator [Pelagicoccus sp. SDUM812005]
MNQASRKRVAIIMPTGREECLRFLRGVGAFQSSYERWNCLLDNDAHSIANPGWLFKNELDGVICHHRNPVVLEECRQRNIPCIDINDETPPRPGIPKIRPDNVAIGQMGGEYLIDRGFKNFGFCGFNDESWSQERMTGFREAVQQVRRNSAELETEYTLNESELLIVVQDDWAAEQEKHIADWIQSLPKPVGIMACNDLRAVQVINACLKLELPIPESVAILGANDEKSRCDLCHPSVSSVPVNAFYWGQRTASYLSKLMNGEGIDIEEELIEPLEVVTRKSTDILAVPDAHIAKAMALIREKACSGLRVEDLLEEIPVSRSYLEKRFRKYFGKSPQMEIRNTQISRIKSLLVETDLTLGEIADRTGFSQAEYLGVVFRRVTGDTPGAFRAKMKMTT